MSEGEKTMKTANAKERSFTARITEERRRPAASAAQVVAQRWVDKLGPRGDRRAPARVLGA